MKKYYKIGIAAFSALIFILIGIQLYNKYSFKAKIEPFIKNVSIRLDHQISTLNDKNSKITFKEDIESLEEDIKESDKNIINIKSLDTTADVKASAAAIAYVTSCQNFTRCLLSQSRAQLKTAIAKEYAQRMVKLLGETSYYGLDYAIKSARQASDEFKKDFNDYKLATAEVIKASENLKETRNVASDSFKNDILFNQKDLNEFIKSTNSSLEN